MRIFKFKYYNNIIGLNSRVAHFNPEISAGCTFCNIVGPRPIAAETMEHLFFACPSTNKILRTFTEKYFIDYRIEKESFFWGIVSENEKENICATILFDFFRYLIWQAKLEKKIPTVSQFFCDMEFKLYTIGKNSRKIKQLFDESNIISVAGDANHRRRHNP
jgi:hypothetical protein